MIDCSTVTIESYKDCSINLPYIELGLAIMGKIKKAFPRTFSSESRRSG